MRHDTATRLSRIALALVALATLQGCMALQNVRVAPMSTENSSSHRSMLSQFNPLPFQHRALSDGALLRAPEDRTYPGRYFFRF